MENFFFDIIICDSESLLASCTALCTSSTLGKTYTKILLVACETRNALNVVTNSAETQLIHHVASACLEETLSHANSTITLAPVIPDLSNFTREPGFPVVPDTPGPLPELRAYTETLLALLEPKTQTTETLLQQRSSCKLQVGITVCTTTSVWYCDPTNATTALLISATMIASRLKARFQPIVSCPENLQMQMILCTARHGSVRNEMPRMADATVLISGAMQTGGNTIWSLSDLATCELTEIMLQTSDCERSSSLREEMPDLLCDDLVWCLMCNLQKCHRLQLALNSTLQESTFERARAAAASFAPEIVPCIQSVGYIKSAFEAVTTEYRSVSPCPDSLFAESFDPHNKFVDLALQNGSLLLIPLCATQANDIMCLKEKYGAQSDDLFDVACVTREPILEFDVMYSSILTALNRRASTDEMIARAKAHGELLCPSSPAMQVWQCLCEGQFVKL